jgi:hypothetical protein
MAVMVERDRADRAIFDVDVEEVVARAMADLVMLLAAAGGEEIVRRRLVEILVAREFVGALAAQEDVRRAPITARARLTDCGSRSPGNGAGIAVASVHDRRVHLDRALIGEHRAAPCIEVGSSSSARAAASTASSALAASRIPIRRRARLERGGLAVLLAPSRSRAMIRRRHGSPAARRAAPHRVLDLAPVATMGGTPQFEPQTLRARSLSACPPPATSSSLSGSRQPRTTIRWPAFRKRFACANQ